MEEDLAQAHRESRVSAPWHTRSPPPPVSSGTPSPAADDSADFDFDIRFPNMQQQRYLEETVEHIRLRDPRMAGSAKRSRDRFEYVESKDTARALSDRGAVAAVLYRNATPDPGANDIWPEHRSTAKLPIRYSLLNLDIPPPALNRTKRRLPSAAQKKAPKGKRADEVHNRMPDGPVGRPRWNLPVELVELIADYLNRDDIKSLRMVSHELNYYVSQVIFQTVVVPFNTEIYGMLAQGEKPDLKGKNRATSDKRSYLWKNANGDEVYNGHGLDVFKGFGRHILKYGMSFEVNEDSLAQPPTKSLTEKKTSFWGSYDWPFEDYRRFDAVAGLETAADETPRMKLAFSELTKVKELALSVDSGLGWLSGPDKSIRAQILRNPPTVFGTSKAIPDRRAQAQQELWRHIQSYHKGSDQHIKLATLYRLEGTSPLSEIDEARMLAEQQPEMPYLDAHIIHEAVPHDTTETPLPTSFDDPEVLDQFVLAPSSSSAGILFTSMLSQNDVGSIMSPVIPANLTKAQKEWLLETEWAQHAFISSYMLSIIDNPSTFVPIHTLNISRISDRYLATLNRADFWDALPNLKNLTLMVIPDWRTVQKDEAGFVHTPRINPINGLGPFCDLLSNNVAQRPGIQSLTIGWIGGGEHAEGLHARNKLIMPAPLIPMGIRTHGDSVFASDMLTELSPDRLRAALLQFPFVERLTLKNCWITPAALLEFVKVHDTLNLKHLCLDSVSMTAVLRATGNGNQAAQQGGVFNIPIIPIPPPNPHFLGGAANVVNNNVGGQGGNQAQAQPLPNNIQWLNWIAHSLQAQSQQIILMQQVQGNAGAIQQQHALVALSTQVQTQLQNLQQMHQQQAQIQQQGQNQQQIHNQQQQQQIAVTTNAVNNLAAQIQVMQQQIIPVVPAQQTQNHPPSPQSLLRSPPREGSWTNIIDMISPGTNLHDFGSEHSKADPERHTSLQSLEFISCGYARLPHATFDQGGFERAHRIVSTIVDPLLVKRQGALAPAMLPAKWAHLGEIVQDADPMEFRALDAGWNLKTGWDDMEASCAVELDGQLRGGTARFTGKLQASDKLSDADEAGSAS
jgi:hypothetical protein